MRISFIDLNNQVVGTMDWDKDDSPPTVLRDQHGGEWAFWNMANGTINYQELDENQQLLAEVYVDFVTRRV